MLNISLIDLSKILGVGYQGEANVFAKGVEIDSRRIKPGDLFFALPGENVDGHHYVEQALANGAVGAVVSKLELINRPENKNLLICPDPVALLQKLAQLIRANINIPVIGITGSTGKTTTKDIVFTLLSQQFKTIKTEGNYNNELGLPITLCRLDKTHQALVLEMGMRGLGQIHFLCQIAQPSYGIITNIGLTHAEILGSQENIAQAKAEILQELPPEGLAILNIGDQKILSPYLKHSKAPIIWYGFSPEADYGVKEIIELGEKGSTFILRTKESEQQLYLGIPGEHNILNALAAIALARSLGMDWPLIQQGLAEVSLTQMRLQVENTPGGAKIINDAYNANPQSMEGALKVLKASQGNRKIAVLGDMYELGIYEEAGHKQVGALAWELKIDVLVTVGKLGQLIGQGALLAGMEASRVIMVQDNQKAVEQLKNIINKEDVILVKGSRGMKMEEIVQGLMG